mmetsp:Transcript_21884/g.41405  ORF Transcript_21884/g.41405 Transcript_21884/m.41405 type:complete len:318 (+) Transcript_21884:84-1037(+)
MCIGTLLSLWCLHECLGHSQVSSHENVRNTQFKVVQTIAGSLSLLSQGRVVHLLQAATGLDRSSRHAAFFIGQLRLTNFRKEDLVFLVDLPFKAILHNILDQLTMASKHIASRKFAQKTDRISILFSSASEGDAHEVAVTRDRNESLIVQLKDHVFLALGLTIQGELQSGTKGHGEIIMDNLVAIEGHVIWIKLKGRVSNLDRNCLDVAVGVGDCCADVHKQPLTFIKVFVLQQNHVTFSMERDALVPAPQQKMRVASTVSRNGVFVLGAIRHCLTTQALGDFILRQYIGQHFGIRFVQISNILGARAKIDCQFVII